MLKRYWQRLGRGLARIEEGLEGVKRRLLPAPVVVFRDVTAPWLASGLTLAVELKLAERLATGPVSLESLAEQTQLPTAHLARFLGFLQAHGYFTLDRHGTVGATRLSRALLTECGGAFAGLQGSRWYREAFEPSHVLHSWRAERSTAFEVGVGQPFFDHLAGRPDRGSLFSQAMSNITRFCAPYLVEAIPLKAGWAYLDVGGADGELSRALAQRYPRSQVHVFDRAPGPQGGGVAHHQGDFFEGLPSGYQGLCLKNILHDWADEEALVILRRCREAVSAGEQLFVIECLLESGSAQTHALDWNVWLTLFGRERSLEQYQSLLEQAGWEFVQARTTATPYSVLEARAR